MSRYREFQNKLQSSVLQVILGVQRGISFLRAKFRHANTVHSSSIENILSCSEI